MTRHKHADIIHAWAEGAEIEVKIYPQRKWEPIEKAFPSIESPAWYNDSEYRIKPTPKPDYYRFVVALQSQEKWVATSYKTADDKIKVTYSGETDEIIAVEIIK